jgi:hypothetical protein
MDEDPELVKRLSELHQGAGLPDAVSLLRVLDAVTWMKNSGGGAAAHARVT